MGIDLSNTRSDSAGFVVKVKKNLRAIRSAVNPKLLCNSKILRDPSEGPRRSMKMRADSRLAR